MADALRKPKTTTSLPFSSVEGLLLPTFSPTFICQHPLTGEDQFCLRSWSSCASLIAAHRGSASAPRALLWCFPACLAVFLILPSAFLFCSSLKHTAATKSFFPALTLITWGILLHTVFRSLSCLKFGLLAAVPSHNYAQERFIFPRCFTIFMKVSHKPQCKLGRVPVTVSKAFTEQHQQQRQAVSHFNSPISVVPSPWGSLGSGGTCQESFSHMGWALFIMIYQKGSRLFLASAHNAIRKKNKRFRFLKRNHPSSCMSSLSREY